MSYVSLPSDSNCPYVGKAAPARKPGTIVVYGHTDRTGRLPRVTEYGIIGFDDKVNEPLRDRTVPGVENYFVLFSLSALDEDR